MTNQPTFSARIPQTAPTITQLAELFDGELNAESFGDERGGVIVPSERPIIRFGFALDPDDGLAEWARKERLDGLFLHRHWKLDAGALPTDIGVVAYHKPYDAHLTTGPNAPLARELGLQSARTYGEKDGAPIGMIGEIHPLAFEMVAIRVHHIFGEMEGLLAPRGGDSPVTRLAVMSAISDDLIRAAAADKVDVYITGQYRVSAAKAIQETGIGVIAVGHTRSEQWGLHVLARLAAFAFPGLETAIYRPTTSLGKQVTEPAQSPRR